MIMKNIKEIIQAAKEKDIDTEELERFFFEKDGTDADGSWRRTEYDKYMDQKLGLHFGTK